MVSVVALFYPKPLSRFHLRPIELGLTIIQGNSILSVNDPSYTENRTYASLIPKDNSLELEIIAEIKKYDWNDNIAIAIAECESTYNYKAYNPETESKRRGLTKYSSCGIFQINSSECYKENSPLYNWQYNISKAYEKYLKQGWGAWKLCWVKIIYDERNI